MSEILFYSSIISFIIIVLWFLRGLVEENKNSLEYTIISAQIWLIVIVSLLDEMGPFSTIKNSNLYFKLVEVLLSGFRIFVFRFGDTDLSRKRKLEKSTVHEWFQRKSRLGKVFFEYEVKRRGILFKSTSYDERYIKGNIFYLLLPRL